MREAGKIGTESGKRRSGRRARAEGGKRMSNITLTFNPFLIKQNFKNQKQIMLTIHFNWNLSSVKGVYENNPLLGCL